MEDFKSIIYFDNSGHLNDEAKAFYAHRIINNDESVEIPEPVLNHFEDCEECKTEILDFAWIMKKEFKPAINAKPDLSVFDTTKNSGKPKSKPAHRIFFQSRFG